MTSASSSARPFRPHARRRGRPRRARPPRLVAEALPRHTDRDLARLRPAGAAAGRGPTARRPRRSLDGARSRRSRPSSPRSRPRSTSAASPCTASTKTTAARSPRASAAAARVEAAEDEARTPTPRTRTKRRPTGRHRQPRGRARLLGRRGRLRPLRRPPRHRCASSRPSPSPSTRCPSARPACSPATTACRSTSRPPDIRSPSPTTASSSMTRAPAGPHGCRARRVRRGLRRRAPTRSGTRPRPCSIRRGHDLRTWLATGFFEHHLKRHSKSRRKAPILWQLGTPRPLQHLALRPPAHPRQPVRHRQRESSRPSSPTRSASSTSLRPGRRPQPDRHASGPRSPPRRPSSRSCAPSLDEVRRVAPLWNPDLDDGIVLVDGARSGAWCPHKPWQKELKSRWDELVAGKYDWAHLAMHLWPERVVPKCATDRSLAIAHGLEDVFWVEGADGKWTKRGRRRPARRGARRRAHLAGGQGRPGRPARGTGARGRRAGPGSGGGSELMHPLHEYIARHARPRGSRPERSWSGTTRAQEFAPFVEELRGGAAGEIGPVASIARRALQRLVDLRRVDVRAARGRRAA